MSPMQTIIPVVEIPTAHDVHLCASVIYVSLLQLDLLIKFKIRPEKITSTKKITSVKATLAIAFPSIMIIYYRRGYIYSYIHNFIHLGQKFYSGWITGVLDKIIFTSPWVNPQKFLH